MTASIQPHVPPAQHILASHPLLRWDAIAAHACYHHGVTWPTVHAAVTAITGAFDSITPRDCSYDPADGTISSPPLQTPPSWLPAWRDAQRLNCVIAALAALLPECDLQAIYDEESIVA